MRDEEMALRDEEVTGELPADLEFEEFNEIREQLAALIEAQLAVYKEEYRWISARWHGSSGAVSARASLRRGADRRGSGGTAGRRRGRFHRTAGKMAADVITGQGTGACH